MDFGAAASHTQCADTVAKSTSESKGLLQQKLFFPGDHTEKSSDEIAQEKVEGDFERPAQIFQPTLFHMHIAKNAGNTFLSHATEFLPQGHGYFIKEACHDLLEMSARGLGLPGSQVKRITLIREPRAQVQSLFIECAYDGWGRWKTHEFADAPQLSSLSDWLSWFSGDFTSLDFNCYHPLNFQSRHFGCRNLTQSQGFDCHHAWSEDLPLPINKVLERMRSYDVVGLVERMQESVCLLLDKATGELPAFCNCEDEAWNDFPSGASNDVTHSVPPHSVADLSSREVEMIDALTVADAVLWKASVERFLSDIDIVEKKHRVRVLCDRQILKPLT